MDERGELDSAPSGAVRLMSQCWEQEPLARPSGFDEISKRLEKVVLAERQRHTTSETRAYKDLLSMAYADGVLDAAEETRLAAARQQYGITTKQHAGMVAALGAGAGAGAPVATEKRRGSSFAKGWSMFRSQSQSQDVCEGQNPLHVRQTQEGQNSVSEDRDEGAEVTELPSQTNPMHRGARAVVRTVSVTERTAPV
jgi:hypothetical protein